MSRIRYVLLAVLVLGTACSGDSDGSAAPPETVTTTTTAETTTTTTSWSDRVAPAWEEFSAGLTDIEAKLDSYTWEELRADIIQLWRQSRDFLSDLRQALPPTPVIVEQAKRLGAAIWDFGRELADATDCEQSENCKQAREFLREQINNFRQAWQEATAPR